jgi:hypothetical protein
LGGTALPLEGKSAVHVRTKSLRTYLDRHHPARAYRLSLARHEVRGDFTNIPLYAVEAILPALAAKG